MIAINKILHLMIASSLVACSGLHLESKRNPASIEQKSCQTIISSVSSTQIKKMPYKDSSVLTYLLDSSASKIRLRTLGDQPQNVALGINNGKHAYIVIGDTRYDGDVLTPPIVRKTDALDQGIIFHFTDLSPEAYAKMKAFADKAAPSTNCIAYACGVLASGGVHLDQKYVLPHNQVNALFSNKIFDDAGNEVPHKVYNFKTSYQIDDLYNEIQKQEKPVIISIAIILSPLPITGAVILINQHKENNRPKSNR